MGIPVTILPPPSIIFPATQAWYWQHHTPSPFESLTPLLLPCMDLSTYTPPILIPHSPPPMDLEIHTLSPLSPHLYMYSHLSLAHSTMWLSCIPSHLALSDICWQQLPCSSILCTCRIILQVFPWHGNTNVFGNQCPCAPMYLMSYLMLLCTINYTTSQI